MAPYIKDKRHLVGIILVFIGVILILDNIRFLPNFIPWWIWTWQFLLITIGVFSLLTTDKIGPGVILIGIGSIFLLSDVLPHVWPQAFDLFDRSVFWYLVIIIVGVSLILKRRSDSQGPSRRHSRRPKFGNSQDGDSEAASIDIDDSGNDYMDEVAIFGGGNKIYTSKNFKGGRITAIFGGSEIDLTESQLAQGVIEIEVFAMFGGWGLIVPRHWQVKSDVVAVFGGISDKRKVSAEAIKDNTRQLVIKGFVMFGGGEIKSY